ncbi:hypothetical protein [Chondrinema litorale]|uniref:hypothetical protein n=1 Tax=Chondrinema litorale TaxID=2994555 RepID=UPI002542D412|nr:hypothetical protein [Chondrinema litorale]UZR93081.1 hypothetical protein OQ292_14565 [Chondrinema litorale]
MELVFMVAGFMFAAYSVVANDVIQTLGTFLSSNRERPWWILSIYTGGILSVVLVYGWLHYNGDVSYGRLSSKGLGELPSPFYWWYMLPPLVLLIITRYGIPVSTTFLILSIFSISSDESIQGNAVDILISIFSGKSTIGKMLSKSILGYIVAFGAAIVLYFLIAKKVEKYFLDHKYLKADNKWVVMQWFSTGFLWSQWLIQDLANIYVFLPRELPLAYLIFSLVLILSLICYIFYNKGGSIQKIVTSKTNTTDIRSATIIDFIYGIILLIFKEMSNIPMSTTWVFVGLLAGREFAISYQLNIQSFASVFQLVLRDLAKIMLGLVVSILLVLLISMLQ